MQHPPHHPSPPISQSEQVSRLNIAVWGWTGDNGLIGTSRKHAERLDVLERYLHEVQAVTRMAKWIGLGIASLIGFLATDTVATVLRRVLLVIAGPP